MSGGGRVMYLTTVELFCCCNAVRKGTLPPVADVCFDVCSVGPSYVKPYDVSPSHQIIARSRIY